MYRKLPVNILGIISIWFLGVSNWCHIKYYPLRFKFNKKNVNSRCWRFKGYLVSRFCFKNLYSAEKCVILVKKGAHLLRCFHLGALRTMGTLYWWPSSSVRGWEQQRSPLELGMCSAYWNRTSWLKRFLAWDSSQT